jgi:peptidoglycan/xylan/chitin deacetylase (PgdA/CDA1 family)
MSAGTSLSLGPRPVAYAKRALTQAMTTRWRMAGRPVRSGLRILTYHRVADSADPLGVSVSAFIAQVQWLAARRVSVTGVTAALASGETLRVALSFDDGYRDAVQVALPILQRHGFGATLYVVPHAVDGTSRFSWYASMPPLAGWDEIAQAADAGFEIGAHSLSHPDLTAVSADRCREEITLSAEVIRQMVGRPVPSFCYPAGRFGQREQAIVEQAGYRNAVTSNRGAWNGNGDPLSIPRIAIERDDTLLDFECKVLGGHDRPLPFTAAYRRVHDRWPSGAQARSHDEHGFEDPSA